MSKVSNDLIDKVTELCLNISQALKDTTYEEVVEYFVRNYLGAALGVTRTMKEATAAFTQEQWQEAYEKFEADAKAKLVTS